MKIFKAENSISLRDFTDSVYPQGGFVLANLLRAKDVKVNGARVSRNVMLNAGDEVIYFTTQRQEAAKSHTEVYSDENVYIADKFSGVSSEGLLSELCSAGEYYACHRLDRNTQGLMVFAKNRMAEEELLFSFRERKIIKTYYALCKNNFKRQSATISAYLVKDRINFLVKIYGGEVSGGVKIITEYSVEKTCGDIVLVKIILHTGKTHQIRAHMAFIGCPVVGDEKYGDSALNKKYGVKRQCLVAKRLEFSLGGNLKYLNGKKFESSFMPEVKK